MLKSICIVISIPFILFTQDVSSQDTLTVFIPDYGVTDESTITLPVQFNHFDSIVNFQFSLAWDSTVLDFVSVANFNLDGLNESSFNVELATVNSGRLGCFWVDNTTLGVSLEDSIRIFEVSFDIINEDVDSTKIIFANDPTDVEAGNVYESVIPFKTDSSIITFDAYPLSIEGVEKKPIELYQNSPNPFQDNTTVTFYLNSAEDVVFHIYDVSGRKVYESKSFYPKGLNNIKLNKLQLTGPGVYEYSLTVKEKTKTKKLVLLN